jgi:hypothetical protein
MSLMYGKNGLSQQELGFDLSPSCRGRHVRLLSFDRRHQVLLRVSLFEQRTAAFSQVMTTLLSLLPEGHMNVSEGV